MKRPAASRRAKPVTEMTVGEVVMLFDAWVVERKRPRRARVKH